MAFRKRNIGTGPIIGLPKQHSPFPEPRKRSRGLLADRSLLVFRLPKKERTSLTREMSLQVRKLITRQVIHQITPFKVALHLERRLRAMETRLGRTSDSLSQDLEELRSLWATPLTGRTIGGKPPTRDAGMVKMLTRGLHGRYPSWLKRQLQRIKRQDFPRSSGTNLVLLTAPKGPGGSPSPADSLSREGLSLLLNMLNAVPNTPPILKRLSSRLRKGMPVSILPPNPNPTKQARKRTGMVGPAEDLKLRQPIRGVLQMRIEPPEAARALAEHMGFANKLPLVYKLPTLPNPPQEAVNKAKTGARIKPAVEMEWAPVEMEDFARAARATIRKDLFDDLPVAQVRRLADEVFQVIDKRLRTESQRRGRR